MLTAAALRAWPEPATTPKAIASLRCTTADARQISEALADAYVLGQLPDFAAVAAGHQVDLPDYPFERRQYWFRDNRSGRTSNSAWVCAPKLSGCSRTAASTSWPHCSAAIRRASMCCNALPHNTISSAARSPSSTNATRSGGRPEPLLPGRRRRRGLDPGRRPATLAPLAGLLTERSAEHRVIGLPVTDADEEALEAQLHEAAEGKPLRIVLACAPDPAEGSESSTQSPVLGAAARPGRRPATVPRNGCRRSARAHLGGDARRAAIADTDTVVA